ncbi:hypothetical protein E8E11_003031 [Didymella keratinophila]|nr:hypothetical protein E8E11_003031 [Didymella keratinophila]
MALIAAGAAGTAALAAYLNAKFHIVHDLKHARGGLAPSQVVLDFMTERVMKKRVLTYHVLEDQALRNRPNHPFLIFEGKTWTYKQFFEAITRVGNWLMNDLNVQVGEMVAIDGGNSPEYLMLWFALDAIGASISYINWNLTGAGLVHCAKLCQAKHLIADVDVKSNVEASRTELQDLGLTIHCYDPSFIASLPDSTPIPETRRESVPIESVRGLIYTSGTTGLPKGVVMTTGPWGNGMRPDVWEPFRERFNIPIINELYAATDGLGATFNRNAGPFTAHTIGLRGLIWNWRFNNEEVRVKMDVDTEDIMRDENGFAIRCGTNEPGQVLHRLTPETLPSVPRYYNNDSATEKRRISDVFQKGDMWFKSGDMMRQDSDGRVFFVDRLGDTFRWKSENVSTNEVADMIGKFPQIAETNVYGVSVPGYDGRAGAASVVMAEGVTESTFDFQALAKHARAVLPGYAVPLFLRVTPALEYTGTMKIQKGRLKTEGIDVDKVTGNDKLYWLPPNSDRYQPYGRKEWEGIKDKSIRCT